MNIRTVSTAATALLALAVLAGCTTTIAGTPGPRPTVSSSGDFPTGSDAPTGTDSPTDEPTSTDSPTDEPTDEPTDTPSETGSVEQLCSDLSTSIDGPDIGESGYKALVGLDILGWGLANGDTDPFASVDAATTKTCPDVRTAVLAKTKTPDLKSLGD